MVEEKKPMDRIVIRDLSLRCVIGLNDWERDKRQDVVVNLTLHVDLSKAGESDRIEDTIDYKRIKDRIVGLVEDSQFRLIERLADGIAKIGLDDPRVERVDVALDKPGALRFARSAAVEITRYR